MGPPPREQLAALPATIAESITRRRRIIITGMLVVTVLMAAGMTTLDQSPGLDQFEFETEEGEALEFIETNFDLEDDETTVQIVLRDQDNALSRESLIATLDLQQDILEDDRIEPTLSEDEPVSDLASIIATQAIAAERGAELEQRATALEQNRTELEETAQTLADGLNETIAIQTEHEQLNASFAAGEIDEANYTIQATQLEANQSATESELEERLTDEQWAAYAPLLSDARSLQADIVQAEIALAAGEITPDERDEIVEPATAEIEALYGEIETTVLGPAFADLAAEGAALEEDRQALEELDPSLDEQRSQLEEMSDEEVEELVSTLLGPDAPRDFFFFVPTDYTPGETETDARQLFVTQVADEELVEGAAPNRIIDSQLAINELVSERFDRNAFAFGVGIITDEIDRSMADSLAIVLPLALIFVVIVLSIAYRDPLDIVLGLLGIIFVLIWTFGFMGWTGIVFNQIMIAVPVLLVGLSIDYAIHVFMRHREQRTDGYEDTTTAMYVVLLGLGAALVWVTITAIIGFLANLVSPVAPIRDFGIASAFGILATLLIFGILIPASKVSLDRFLEERGYDRQRRAFGTGGGSLTRVLSLGAKLGNTAPVAVLVVALLLTGAGIYGGLQVDTEFRQEDFIADEPPGWTDRLPSLFAPGDYAVKSQLEFVNERFLRQDLTTQILIRGDVGQADSLERIHDVERDAAERDVVFVLPTGQADIQSPLSSMRAVADENETFAAVFSEADTTGNDVPDSNIPELYEAYFQAAPDDAAQWILRTEDDTYDAARITMSIRGDVPPSDATSATRDLATALTGDEWTSTATGQLVVFEVIENELFDSVFESLIVTMIAAFLFLMVAYRIVHGSALLGAITLTPILLTVAWILGTMYLAGIPFNVVTGTITSLTIGLGVAYNIHISERYRLERTRGHEMFEAMRRAVTGTGGALLGSAATTMGGFGVLAFAILPPLRQFGIITATTIFYAFLGSVFVLPSFLMIWTRYLAPDRGGSGRSNPGDESAATESEPVDMSTANEPPQRIVDPKIAGPGQTVSVTVTGTLGPGRVVLREVFPGEDLALKDVDPAPTTAAVANGSLYVAWEFDGASPVELSYSGRAPETGEDATVEWAGTLVASHGGSIVEGTRKLRVVDDFVDRVLLRDEPTETELSTASEAFENGRITEEEFRKLIESWRRAAPDPPEPEEATEESTEESVSWLDRLRGR